MKDNALVEWSKTSKKPLKNFFCHLEADQDRYLYKMIASHHLTIVGKKLKDGSMLVVCSNSNNPTHVLSTYRRRWDIESMFKNLKTQGFNIEDTHMTCLQRLKKLMAVVAIATFCMCLIGSHQTCAFKKTVNSPLYSIFTRGLRWIRHMVNRDYQECERQFYTFLTEAKKSEG